MKMIVIVLCLVFSFAAESMAETCIDFQGCTKVMHNLLGQDYIWAEPINIKFGSSGPIELKKENAELLFTAVLNQAGYSRIPVGDGKTYRIVSGATPKESETPIFEASAESMPNLPNTWDVVSMRYKLKSPEMASELEAAFRYHVPREARLQADANVGTLFVTGAIPVVRHMYQMFTAADKPMSAAYKEKMKTDERKRVNEQKTKKKTEE